MKRSGEGRGEREGVRTGSGKKKSQAKCEVAKKQLNKKKKGGGGRSKDRRGWKKDAVLRQRCKMSHTCLLSPSMLHTISLEYGCSNT